jgi:hypothetical protein
MKGFNKFRWDPDQCRQELTALRQLLGSAATLKERSEILPFLQQHVHLSSFIGSYDSDVTLFDLYAHEYPLFGDFTCDLVVGDSQARRYVFVEFEDAAPQSLFVPKKATPEWAPRFEHGYSQILDWFWKLHDMEKTHDYADRFGAAMRYSGLLIVGRAQHLEPRELRRLEWREDLVRINSRPIRCRTYDQLADDLERRLTAYPKAAAVDSARPATCPGAVERAKEKKRRKKKE